MKQKGVTQRALDFIIVKYKGLLDLHLTSPTEAFIMKKGEIKGISSIGGTTLRKIFDGNQVHVNTIRECIESLGSKWCLDNGAIDIDLKLDSTQLPNGVYERDSEDEYIYYSTITVTGNSRYKTSSFHLGFYKTVETAQAVREDIATSIMPLKTYDKDKLKIMVADRVDYLRTELELKPIKRYTCAPLLKNKQ